jgi:pimeloyl-ACP methyl ester carboxylesterase
VTEHSTHQSTDLSTDLVTDLVVHRWGRAPGEAPTMVFLHGLTDSGRGWPEAVRHWGEAYHVVSHDARGHGESPRFTADELAGHPGDVMVDDAVRVLEQLDRPVVVGHSLGGAVGLTVGVRRPELVRALVLEDPAPLGPDEPLRTDRGPERVAGLEPSLSAPDEEALRRVRAEQHPDWPDSELLVTGVAERQMDLDYLRLGEFKPTTPWPQLFAAVTVPTLVVSGDAHDPSTCVDRAVEDGVEATANPVVTLVRIPGAGHCVRRDRPAEFYATVDRWLSAL